MAVDRLSGAYMARLRALAERLDVKAAPDIAGAWDVWEEAAAVEPAVRANMQRLAEVGAWEVLAEWNPDSVGWSPEMIEAWIAKAASTNAERWATGVRDGLAAAVVEERDTMDALRDFVSSNALAIALATAFITEAVSFGGTDAARKSGLGVKTWVVTSANPRPGHAALNGETVPIDDVFGNGLRWPGDSFGTAADNANCACRLRYGRA